VDELGIVEADMSGPVGKAVPVLVAEDRVGAVVVVVCNHLEVEVGSDSHGLRIPD
jgi:hypothetical protein